MSRMAAQTRLRVGDALARVRPQTSPAAPKPTGRASFRHCLHASLIRMLTGLTVPTDGKVLWDDTDLATAHAESVWRHVGRRRTAIGRKGACMDCCDGGAHRQTMRRRLPASGGDPDAVV
ncbi:hypothetical protein GCM10010307_58710 [Streptomyces vastus]|uniref:Transposase n=1 Tax=Streptomyces vastus TaxID=285451 RepID=A0ABP6DTX7_9ACTN